MSDINQDVAAYIAELNEQGVVSRSHHTLHYLYVKYGKRSVDRAVDSYWAKQENENEQGI